MKKMFGYVVGLGVSAMVIIGGVSTAVSTTKTLLNKTTSSAVYEVTGNAVNNAIHGFMGAVTGNGFDVSGYLTSVKDDIVDVGAAVLPTANRSKAKSSAKVEYLEPGQYSNYVEGFH